MSMPQRGLMIAGIAVLLAAGPSVLAGATAEELARLGQDLTPLGAEKAGNADGTIPAWEGGLTAPPANYRPGDHHPEHRSRAGRVPGERVHRRAPNLELPRPGHGRTRGPPE